ncbi:MAG: cell division topological specificity factor MinE [Clostridia bacterium]|nr:cell division topological specificity factor MinE [Clostridia bacterium]
MNFFKNLGKTEKSENNNSRDTAKERLHLVLMQDRANVSADFLDLMRQEIIEVIKKYVEVDEREIDVRITNKQNDDGSNGEPALFANIPIVNIKNDILVEKKKEAEMARLENVKIETREQITENHEEENLEIRNDEHTEETNEPINEEGHKPEAVES